MFTAPQSDPVTFWQPSFSHPNVVVTASAKSPLAPALAGLWPVDANLEVVHVYNASDALTLVERGRVAVVAVVEPLEEEGWTQLLMGALARAKTPRFVLLSSKASQETAAGWLKMKMRADAGMLKTLVNEAAAESQRGPDRLAVRPLEILAAVSAFPEAAWLRFTGDPATGDICFRNGVAVYAESGKKSGRAALDEILSWPACECEYREYPSVLPSNVNALLADLVRGAAAVSHTSAPAPALELEEPSDFPDFVAEPVAAAFASEDPDEGIPEPDEMAIDAALDMLAAEAAEVPAEFPAPEAEPETVAPAAAGEVDSPDSLDVFDLPASQQLASPDLRSTIFTCVAVMEEGVVELCEPPAGYKEFDPSSICHTFNGIRQLVESRSMGLTNSVLIRATQSSLVVAQVPGSKRVLAAKFSGLRFGAAEEMELHRLLENAAILCPAAAV